MRATRDVENSISNIAIFPSFVSKHFENGSVVYIRNPREVPKADSYQEVDCYSIP